eukprot:Plantae.Rhodophyta-Palmaria_palmata.ctg19175.p1 GENE.Plantae.Rhodophyta-Palmaria_palmata.ctg19175~~Plantae.Rhodophyta-Palmaria_palmata.ctg19175.p1  ORF type:complete len:243 (-),score=56.69 Plantae.Rhodophyta-Palmaria_palmata.ctg19175:353-1081(-)
MVDADIMWKRQLASQRNFAESFRDGFVAEEGDTETYAVLEEFQRGATERYDHFVRSTTKEDETFAKMHVQLRAYLAEVTDVEKRYGELVTAKSEVTRYQSKVDSIELKKKTNDLKKSRNLQKMDAERERYGELTADIVASQKDVYAKAAIVHRMALCSYWAAHTKHIEVLSRSMTGTAAWAEGVEEEMLAIDVASLDMLDSAAGSEVSAVDTSSLLATPPPPVKRKAPAPNDALRSTPVLAT